MERTITEHEIKGEYNFIRDITITYFTTSDGVEHKGNPHRGPQHVPGVLVEGAYVKTDMSTLGARAKAFATHLWTPELHTDYSAHLVAQADAAGL